MEYKPTIGLEIHSELKTNTKMFCGCLNDPNETHPNVNICPICMGHPGTLPVINKKAVESVLKLGLALGSRIPKVSKFDRKNYFYPDLPKGYQISQYDKPLVLGGELKGVKITRVHLEEDTARLQHSTDGKSSLVDFNRAGVPLMELVTEPDIKSGKQAVAFAKELQLILRYLGISYADMEKGQMRVEANISISKSDALGTKVEIKNLNSFRAVQDAINYEIKRQAEHLEEGKEVKQETRGWDENKKVTVSQRSKEEAHDYRYFPEPDLPPMDTSVFDLENLKIELPELPEAKRKRFVEEFSLRPEQVDILIENRDMSEYFEESASELKTKPLTTNYQLLFNYLTSDLRGLVNEGGVGFKESKITPDKFADLVALIIKGDLSSRLAKDILREMFLSGVDVHQIISEKRLAQISDEEVIKKAIEEVIAENPAAVADYKKGKENALQFLFGKAMAKLKGQGSPEIIRKLLSDSLSN